MSILNSVLSFFRFYKKRPDTNIIIVGVDYPSFSLASELQKLGGYKIIAFIDDEPWTNKTQLLGATLHYPSDIEALIERHNVSLLISFEENHPQTIDAYHKDLLIILDATSQLHEQITCLMEAAKERYL